MSPLQFPDNLSPEQFLEEYWQKKPLLMRAAIPGFTSPLTPDELAGLACEDEIESRVVLEKDGSRPWEARFGPFSEQDFASLPESHWTLLVQDVDKHVPEVSALLDSFRFIPDWRLDDIMISYAADQGSVGPHIDDYDVFLIQASGKRRWLINTEDVEDTQYIEGLDLRILPELIPEFDWTMEPGDVLYLPPNVAHWGIAQGDGCITCSVGFRAPSWSEMTASWCDELIGSTIPTRRFRDQQLSLQQHNGEILPSVLQGIRHQMLTMLSGSEELHTRWFGAFITETKNHLEIHPREQPASADELTALFASHQCLVRHPWARMVFIRGETDKDYLYVNGDEFALAAGSGDFLPKLTAHSPLDYTECKVWLDDEVRLQILNRLYNANYLLWPEEAEGD
jgi:50S ribosomal protein L16 3-hydroxylase